MKLKIIIVCLFLAGCAPTSTIPFEPQKKVTTKELQLMQVKSQLPVGTKDPYSGMSCRAYVEYQIAFCEAALTCSAWQYRRYKRELRLMSKIYSGQCLYSPGHLREILRRRPGL